MSVSVSTENRDRVARGYFHGLSECAYVSSPPVAISFQSLLVAMPGHSRTSRAVQPERISCWDTGSVTELAPRQWGDHI